MLSRPMKIVAAVASFLIASAAHAAPIGYEGARHLLNRAGFGATDAEVRQYARLERNEAVDGARFC